MLAGCGLTLGESYRTRRVPEGMAMVYLYGLDVGTGQTVYLDKEPTTPSADRYWIMVDGGFAAHLQSPGPLRIVSGGSLGGKDDCIVLQLRADVAYFVRVRGDGTTLTLVTPDVGRREIAQTRALTREHRGQGGSIDQENLRCVDAEGATINLAAPAAPRAP